MTLAHFSPARLLLRAAPLVGNIRFTFQLFFIFHLQPTALSVRLSQIQIELALLVYKKNIYISKAGGQRKPNE